MGESTKTEYPIKTIVLLVQENRSFDHILGWMKSINPEIDGVTGNESNPMSKTSNTLNHVNFSDQSTNEEPDPGHSFEATYDQIFGVPFEATSSSSKNLEPTMQGFAQQAESIEQGMSKIVMNGFKPDALPVYKALVKEYGVCDRWFSSVPSLTQPNRLFIHSATSNGTVVNDTNELIQGFPQKTIFESLEENGSSFGIYYQYPPSTLFLRNLRKLKYFDNFYQYNLNFKSDCEKGTLPNYVVIEQRYFGVPLIPGNDDHPPHDVSEGQNLVKEIYDALRSSPQWNEILFVILYDEHGGFYDHVPTPTVGIPSPDDIVSPAPHNFKFDRLGVRVPAILVSPWIEPGTVLHKPTGPFPNSEFEHSSIPATLKKIFNLKDFLTKRDAWAGTFESVLNRSTPRGDCPGTMPECPTKSKETGVETEAKLSDFQAEIVQLSAVLNGDHAKDTYPQKIVENLKVSDAADYCGNALKLFRDECDKAKKNGADDHHIVILSNTFVAETHKPKSFTKKLLSCLVCDN
ncbi:phospholipase [Lithospermum erythrorhizon]|uniref:Phospholipase n=1 Tax=Lithospermum erythrorhizon TaxID=34254 RepID=A0AAV3R3H0_LITER